MSIFYLIYHSLIPLLIILIIGLIVYFIIKRKIKKGVGEKDWYLQIFLSKEDAVSQFFFLFSIFFLGITLLTFNRDLGEPLSSRTILLLASVIGLVIAYYFKVIYTLAVSLIGLTFWWAAQVTEWAQGKDIKDTALFTGLLFIVILFYLLSRAHEKEIRFKRVSMVYSILGLIPITGVLFFLSTVSGLKALEEITKKASFFSSWEITLSIFIFLIFIIGILTYTLNKKLIFKLEALIICLLVLLFGIIALLPEQTIILLQKQQINLGYSESVNRPIIQIKNLGLSSIGIFWAIIFNVLVLIETFGLIVLGHFKNENWLKKSGLLFIILLFLVKLFEWIGYSSRENTLLILMPMGALIFLTCGLVVYLLIKSLGKSFNLQIGDIVYSILGAVPLTIFLFFLSSESGLKEFSNLDIKSLPFLSYLLILTTIYLLFNLGLWIYYFRNKINFLKEVSFLLIFLFLLTLIVFAGPHKNLFINNKLSGLGIFWAIIFNIMLFLEIIGILFLGYLNKKHLFINLGVVFIFILIFVKYFDWFFTFLDKSIFFIGAGILLFIVGWFMEKGRRYLLSTIKKEGLTKINN